MKLELLDFEGESLAVYSDGRIVRSVFTDEPIARRSDDGWRAERGELTEQQIRRLNRVARREWR